MGVSVHRLRFPVRGCPNGGVSTAHSPSGSHPDDTPVPYPQALQPPNGVPEGFLRKRSFSAKSLKGSELI